MKRVLACILTLALLLGFGCLSVSAARIMGDVNSDGAVDSTDARLILQYYAKKIEYNELDTLLADVNGDGKADSTDARMILQLYAKKIGEFTEETSSTRTLSRNKLWGVNAHHKGYAAYKAENIDEIIKLAADMGSNIFRFNYNPRNSADLIYVQQIVNKCHAAGMQFMLVLDNFSGTDEEIAFRMAFTSKYLGDQIEFFQIFNETDIWCSQADTGGLYNPTDWTGMSRSYYNPARVEVAVHKMKVALDAFKSQPHTGKICVNFGARHYVMMQYYVEAGLSWDVIGVDNYEIWDYNGFFNMMEEKFPGYEFIIAECNYPFRNRSASEKEEADWLESFLTAIDNLDTDRMLGAIIYELLDQPSIEHGSYDGEAHFGIVHTDQNNNPSTPKEAYYRVQQMLGRGAAAK